MPAAGGDLTSLIFDILDLPIRCATNSLWNWYASRCIIDHGRNIQNPHAALTNGQSAWSISRRARPAIAMRFLCIETLNATWRGEAKALESRRRALSGK